jgi:MFS transporter, SHS family, lactate transporter
LYRNFTQVLLMNERDIFVSVLEIDDSEARRAHLQSACAGDIDLLRRVESLLASHEAKSRFLETPIVEQLAHSPRQGPAATIVAGKDSSRGEFPDAAALQETRGHVVAAVPTREAVFAVIAGFLGWTLDAFDFFLVVIALPAIAKDFGVSEPEIAFSLTLTLMFRPVGAFIFGLLADRYGRRIPMIIDLVFYSVVEVATAFSPNLTVFLILRALFGIGMGGEWGLGTSLVMEKVPGRRRGVLSGLLQEGYAVGYLLSAVAAWFMLDRFGWRVMFLLGGLPAGLTLLIRFGIKESEVWRRTKAKNWSHLVGTLRSYWKIWLYLTLLMAAMNFASHGTQDMFPTFMKQFRGMDARSYTQVVMLMMAGAIVGGITFGLASDRLGRRAMMIIAFVGALAVTPLWAFSSGTAAIIAGAVIMQFMVQGAWGIIPAHINELSPDRVRGFLPGFAYQCGNFIAASIASIQSALAKQYPYSFVMAGSAATIFLVAIVVTALGREQHGVVFGGSESEVPPIK